MAYRAVFFFEKQMILLQEKMRSNPNYFIFIK